MTDKHPTKKEKKKKNPGFLGDATRRHVARDLHTLFGPREPSREPRADVGNSSRRIARGWTLYPPLRSPRSPVLSRAATLLAPIVGCYDKWAINFALDLARASRDPRCSLLLDALQERPLSCRLSSSHPSRCSPRPPRGKEPSLDFRVTTIFKSRLCRKCISCAFACISFLKYDNCNCY